MGSRSGYPNVALDLARPVRVQYRVVIKPFVLAAVLCSAAGAQAAFVLTERTTSMTVFYDFGGGGEQFPGSNSVGSTSLNSEFIHQLRGNETRSGFTEFGTWEAGYIYDINQEFQPLTNGFYGAGDVGLQSFLAGDGYSTIEGRNELTLMFDNTSTTDFRLTGAATFGAQVSLDVFDGLGWTSIYTSPGGDGFDITGTIGAGQYRIFGIGNSTAVGQMAQGEAWSFNLQAVPEPSVMAGLGLGALALMRRRRR